MLGTFTSEVELPGVIWCTSCAPSPVRQDSLVVSNMSSRSTAEASSTALLSLGPMQCLLYGSRSPVMHVRCGWEHDDEPPDPLVDTSGAFNAFVVPAGGDILCFALSRHSTAAECAA